MEFQEFVLSLVIVVTLFIALWVASAIRKTEQFKQYEKISDLLTDLLLEGIMYVAYGNPDLSEYNEKAANWEGNYIDPRMWYVLDQAELFLKRYNVDIEFDELVRRAEVLYQSWKREEKFDG